MNFPNNDGGVPSSSMPSSKLDELQDVSPARVSQAKEIVEDMATINDPNTLYQRCFQLLKLGGLEAEIPRLVVFGQQSMGKTTLLDFIMGGPIGFSSTDTGTKQPVVVMLKPTASLSSPIECTLRGQAVEVRDLQEAMKNIMMGIETISAEELELEMAVPGGVHAVFVDLPGIKDDSKEGAELTRSVVKNYVQNNPNDLYILVKKSSDDPANWPWSLREFILSPQPRGLGLTPRQTIVIGTRAKDFLINEKSDVKTHKQLIDRVQKRAVRDSTGQPLPLYLLELFSLSIEDKECQDFAGKKLAMNQQIISAKEECRDLIMHGFEGGASSVRNSLLKYFDVDDFKKDLNCKFQSLLSDQLTSLERRLTRKKLTSQKLVSEVQDQIAEQNPQSLREYIKLFIRELVQIVTELVTGDFMIMRLPNNGDAFMSTFGGTLAENLEDGHKLALELYTQPEQYDSKFLTHVKEHAESTLAKTIQEQEAMRMAAFPLDPTAFQRTCPQAEPNLSGRLQPGQFVRLHLGKANSQMLGHIESMTMPGDKVAQGWNENAELSLTEVNVAFYFIAPNEGEQSQSKPVEQSKLSTVVPLSLIASHSCLPPPSFRCWQKITRSDSWIGLIPIQLRHVQLDPSVALVLGEMNSPQASQAVTGVALYVPLTADKGDLSGTPASDKELSSCRVEEVYCEASTLALGTANVFEEFFWKNMTPLQRIAGDFAEAKLLNQLSLTHLGRWLKFHICSLEPDRKFSDHVILQLMRSVKHVIDKADWEPLVADMLQANVQGSLLHLTRLASCATAVALRRILKASVHEVQRQIRAGDLTSGLMFLCNNSTFMGELDQALETICRERALTCAATMRDLIFEQTHAIHFEMIEDFFDGCRQFEREFLNGSSMEDVARRVKEGLANRKQKLGIADIYARRTAGVSNDMIYEEVRIQFWVVKVLLSAPLTTKLYMYFVKDIKDKSKHLASESKFSSSEGELEKSLQDTILCEATAIPNSRPLPRSDDELINYFMLAQNKDRLAELVIAIRRTEEYVKWALEGVARLRSQKQGGPDFLTRLSLASAGPASPPRKTLPKLQAENSPDKSLTSISSTETTPPRSAATWQTEQRNGLAESTKSPQTSL